MTGGKNDNKDKKGKNAEGNANGGQTPEDPVLKSIFSKLDVLMNEANQRAASTDAILQNISDKFDKFTDGISTVTEEVGHLKQGIISEKRENKSRRHD